MAHYFRNIAGNWSTLGNWSSSPSPSYTAVAAIPTATDDVIFEAPSANCIVDAGPTRVCRTLTFTNYTNTIQTDAGITVSGNITLGSAMLITGTGGLTINVSGTVTITSIGGIQWGRPFTYNTVSGGTINITGDFYVSSWSNVGSNVTINGSTVRVANNCSVAGAQSGTTAFVFTGAGTWSGAGKINGLTINSPGFTRTITGSVGVNISFVWTDGTISAAGSTIIFTGFTLNLGGQTIHNLTMNNGGVTPITVPTSVYLTGNLITPNGTTSWSGAGRVYVAGNLTNQGTFSGSVVVEMNGTGTITGSHFFPIEVNTSGIISTGTTCSVSTFTLTSGTLNLANGLSLNGGTLIISSGIAFTGSSNLTIIANTASITSNGIAWPTSIIMANTVNTATTITLNDPLVVTGSFTSSSAQQNSVSLNGSTLSINGNLTVTKTFGGSTNIFMVGTITAAWTGLGTLGTSLTVSKTVGSGAIVNAAAFQWGGTGKTLLVPVDQTLVLTGGLNLGGGTFDCSAGTFNANLQTVALPAFTRSINMGATNSFYNLSFTASSSIVTMLSNIRITNNISVTGFCNANGAFDITVAGNAGGGTLANTTAGRKITVTAISTGTSTLTTFSVNNFIFEIDCSNRNVSFTGISIYTSCTINYLATNIGGFTTIGHTLSYSNCSINMFSSTNSWNIISASISSTLTLLSDVYCVQFGPTLADTINGLGFFICATTTGALSTLLGNAGLRFVGLLNGTWNQINTNSLAVIEFAKTGVAAVSIPNSFTKNGGTIKWVSGAVTHSITATMTLNTGTTMDTTAVVPWNNITVTAGATITISSPLSILGILNLAGAATFTGVAGWTCANLTCSAAGPINITLQQLVTYTTTSGVAITGGVAAGGLRPTMRSSDATNLAIWTLDPGATQTLIYVNGTRIDSSGGQTIYSFGVAPADITTTINWYIGTRPGTVAHVFVF